MLPVTAASLAGSSSSSEGKSLKVLYVRERTKSLKSGVMPYLHSDVGPRLTFSMTWTCYQAVALVLRPAI